MVGRFTWLTPQDAAIYLLHDTADGDGVVRRLEGMAIPQAGYGEAVLYRGFDIILAFGIRGVCRVCLARIDSGTYCSEQCHALGSDALSKLCAVAELSIPVVTAQIPEEVAGGLRRHAQENGLTVHESLRVALLVGTRAIVDLGQQT